MSIKVFISYSHDSEEHKNRVWELSARLRMDDCIESIIDQYEDSPVDGWALWCEKQIRDADFVLVTCTETYLRRVMKEDTPGKGLGVTWEAEIIRNYIYDSGMKIEKYIPIVFDDTDFAYIPLPLKSTSRYMVSTDDGYKSLFRRIIGQKPPVPAIGSHSSESSSLPIPARKTGFNGFWNVPYSRNTFFSGRKKELQNLHKAFTKQKAVAVGQTHAISGLGGIGKTQLAVEYAYQYRTEYNAVFWVPADTIDTIITGFLSIARNLNLPQKDDSDRGIILSAVKQWLEQNGCWLLIFDNADTPGLLTEFIPTEYTGHLLLTSRAQNFDEIGISVPIELETMEPAEASEFLKKRTGKEKPTEKELHAISDICKELDYLPLALEQAGAYILKLKCSFENYLTAFKSLGLEILNKAKPVAGKYSRSVETTWTLNFNEVEKQSRASVDTLRACAFLYSDNIPLEIFQQGTAVLGENISAALADIESNALLLNELLEPLRQYSLVKLDAESKTIDIHRLVQAVVQGRMNENEKQLWAERVIGAVCKIFPDVEFENWPVCERLLPHAMRCIAHIDEWKIEGENASWLLNAIGCYLFDRARYDEVETIYKSSLEISMKALGKDHPNVATGLSNLAGLYKTHNRYAEAETLNLNSLEINENIFGKDHPDVAFSLNNLAELYRHLGRYTEAEPLYLRSLEIREKALGKDHPDLATCLNNLALLYHKQGRYVEAEPLYLKSLKIMEKALVTNHPKVAICLNNLATFYKTCHRYDEAEPLYLRSLEIRVISLGKDHPNVTNSLNNLVGFYKQQGRTAEADTLLKKYGQI